MLVRASDVRSDELEMRGGTRRETVTSGANQWVYTGINGIGWGSEIIREVRVVQFEPRATVADPMVPGMMWLRTDVTLEVAKRGAGEANYRVDMSVSKGSGEIGSRKLTLLG